MYATHHRIVATAAALGLSVIFSSAHGQNVQSDLAAQVEYTVEELLSSVTYTGLAFAPDGETIITAGDAGGVANVVEISLESGEMRQLTDMDDAVGVIGYFPDDRRLLFAMQRDGDGYQQLFVREADGEVVDITPGDQSYADFHSWAPDGQSFFVYDDSAQPGRNDFYRVSVHGYGRELALEPGNYPGFGPLNRQLEIAIPVLSPEGIAIAFRNLDTGAQELMELGEGGFASFGFPHAFSPDGRFLYYSTDRGHEFHYLMRYDRESRTHTETMRRDWAILSLRGADTVSFTADGGKMAIAQHRDSATFVEVYDTQTMQLLDSSGMDNANVKNFEFSPDGLSFAMIVSNGQMPGDIYLKRIGDGEPELIARSLSDNIDREHLVAGEVVRFDSFDGVSVPGILYKPAHASATDRLPAMIWIHGGPSVEEEIGYRPILQLLANHGYVVYGVNHRGSTGFGSTFADLDNGRHGVDDLRDVITAKQFLIDQGYVDPERIGVMGHSHGGFLTLAALAFYPEVFAVGVDLYGPSDWYRTFASQPDFQAGRMDVMRVEFGDIGDEEFLRTISPLYHAENITKPLLVLQGANDPLVLQRESDEIVAKVRANDVPVEYIVLEGEGHGFERKDSQLIAYSAILDFLEEHLASDGR